MYSVDTNIFLDWWARRYPPDVFPGVRANVEALVTAGKWVAVEGVSVEITHVAPAPLRTWAHAHRAQFVRHDAALLAEANAITRRFPGLIDVTARHDEADRYIIALAKLKGWTVVTHETPAHTKRNPPRSHYIPDVCRELRVPCIGLVELMRAEGWSFA